MRRLHAKQNSKLKPFLKKQNFLRKFRKMGRSEKNLFFKVLRRCTQEFVTREMLRLGASFTERIVEMVESRYDEVRRTGRGLPTDDEKMHEWTHPIWLHRTYDEFEEADPVAMRTLAAVIPGKPTYWSDSDSDDSDSDSSVSSDDSDDVSEDRSAHASASLMNDDDVRMDGVMSDLTQIMDSVTAMTEEIRAMLTTEAPCASDDLFAVCSNLKLRKNARIHARFKDRSSRERRAKPPTGIYSDLVMIHRACAEPVPTEIQCYPWGTDLDALSEYCLSILDKHSDPCFDECAKAIALRRTHHSAMEAWIKTFERRNHRRMPDLAFIYTPYTCCNSREEAAVREAYPELTVNTAIKCGYLTGVVYFGNDAQRWSEDDLKEVEKKGRATAAAEDFSDDVSMAVKKGGRKKRKSRKSRNSHSVDRGNIMPTRGDRQWYWPVIRGATLRIPVPFNGSNLQSNLKVLGDDTVAALREQLKILGNKMFVSKE